MGYVLNRIKAAMQAAADALDEGMRIGYGDPDGSKVFIEGLGWYERGRGWAKDRGLDAGFIDVLLENGVVQELERSPHCYASIAVNASTVSPTFHQNDGITSVTKSEVGGTPPYVAESITLVLDNAYVDSNWICIATIPYMFSIPMVIPISANSCMIMFMGLDGFAMDLNSRTIGVTCRGTLL